MFPTAASSEAAPPTTPLEVIISGHSGSQGECPGTMRATRQTWNDENWKDVKDNVKVKFWAEEGCMCWGMKELGELLGWDEKSQTLEACLNKIIDATKKQEDEKWKDTTENYCIYFQSEKENKEKAREEEKYLGVWCRNPHYEQSTEWARCFFLSGGSLKEIINKVAEFAYPGQDILISILICRGCKDDLGEYDPDLWAVKAAAATAAAGDKGEIDAFGTWTGGEPLENPDMLHGSSRSVFGG